MKSSFFCEIRQLKGVAVVAPGGGDWLIRARFADGALPAAFKSLRASVTLRAVALTLNDAAAAIDGIEPRQGVPEQLTGAVLEQLDEGRILLDTGVLFEVVLPAGVSVPGLGSRVTCTLDGEPTVVELSLASGTRPPEPPQG